MGHPKAHPYTVYLTDEEVEALGRYDYEKYGSRESDEDRRVSVTILKVAFPVYRQMADREARDTIERSRGRLIRNFRD